MFPLSLTSPVFFIYFLLAVLAVVFLAHYVPFRFAKAHKRTGKSQVTERIRELETEREYQSRMLLDLSHNLQTPLAVLKGKVERYERAMVHDGHGVTLSQSIDSVSHLINEVLALSNLERSIREEEQKAFSVSALVLEVVDDASVLASAEGIVITCDIAADITLVGNERRIGDALMNLLGNAVKYMGDGPVRRIRVSLTRQGGQVLLEVTDTGRGIPQAELPRIFERFYRGSARTYGSIPGTGLGLAFVERIVQEHGGVVTVTSEVGKGSTFSLVLPGLRQAHLQTSLS